MRRWLIFFGMVGCGPVPLSDYEAQMGTDGLDRVQISSVAHEVQVFAEEGNIDGIGVQLYLYDFSDPENEDPVTDAVLDQIAREALYVDLTASETRAYVHVGLFYNLPPEYIYEAEIYVPSRMIVEADGVLGRFEQRGGAGMIARGVYGGISGRDINGFVDIVDDRGGISLKRVEGVIDILDGRGGISIKDAERRVTIIDGRGSIKVKNTRAPVKITDEQGRIKIKNVKGDVDIDSDRGRIVIKNINGDAVVSRGDGSVRSGNIAGDLSIRR
ncbi:MAG: hypothetical protein AAFV53_23085 [Myxococcota bacterium]